MASRLLICAADTMLIRDYAQEIRDMEVPVKFIAWNYPPFWDTQVPDNIYPFLECRYEYWTQEPPFNSNFPYGVFTGYSVTYVCIQFAVYAGFSEIYLIGCDHNYAAPQTGAAGNHFVKDYQEKKGEHACLPKGQSRVGLSLGTPVLRRPWYPYLQCNTRRKTGSF